MKEHQKESALYLCDPSKNVTCQKSICQSQCVLTTKVEYAKADADGSPIIVYKNRMEALSSILPKENGTASHKATVSADLKTVHWWLHVFMTGKSCFPLQIAIATRF